MSATVAKKKKTGRFEMKVEPDWLTRVEAEADRWNQTLAAYIRQAVNERMERDASRRRPEQPPQES